MKTLALALIGLFSLFSPSMEQAPVALDDVCRALGGGNVDQLAAAMDAEVELSILDREDLYSRADAIAALKKFFTEHPPSGFGKVHQGASKSDDAEYCIGTLTTGKGPFRVYVYVAKRKGGVLLQELRFDRN